MFTLLNIALFSGVAIAQAVSIGPTVDLGYVTYLGNQSYPNTVAYLGIPYAEPPVGNLRFRATVPLNTTRVTEEAKGEALVNATYYPDFCIQGTTGVGDAGGAGSEDCLKVNVYSPYGAKEGDNLPVLFYIHGGGYVFGNPRNWPFDSWINQSPNVIIVSIYYRLDSFGFLATPEFTDPTYGDFNAGFKDQIQALKWVKSYISKFGGSPTKVTINGQSAGGSSVELHMTANQGEQLFSGAIAQSVFRTPLPTPEQQQPLFQFYALYAGCGTGSVAKQMTCLRGASINALARAQDAAAQGKFSGLYDSFHPVLDGVLITGHPTRMFQYGEFVHVPLIVGSTSNETLSGGANISLALKEFFPSLTDEDIQEFLWLYPADEFDSPSQRFQVATGEPDVICGRQAMGAPSSLYSNTWAYRYNTPNPTSGADIVAHSAENWMMFDGTNTGPNGSTTFTPQTPSELAFASELVAYWLSFVRAGDPNAYKLDKSPTWEQYSETNPTRIVLMQDLQNLTVVSGSYMERQPVTETVRCAFAISKAQACEN
ncbi:Alpha/Beta hydrolase protein [Suillus paluster]|uniref:Alpha/Beta hydrolase protein n=1 Tax=Suillus paluster TaxID=48578 RepID=UPI001B86E036|nr:Alpha/Beta hydrolase protein [Suillus paluster]KAG1737486.1 Alpha/Beta hydrolase protein [Suillus paluster]